MLPVGWKLSCLGDACSGALQTGPFGSQLHAHEYTEQGISVLMPKDLINYRANVETAAKISIEKSEELKRHHLKFGDILFSRRGDVARLALIDDNSKDSLCGTGCLRARPSTKNFAGFLFFFLQLPTIKSWLEHNAVGQTMPNMNTEILYELPLILPPLPEQKKIAAILSTWDRAIEGTEKLLANSQQQKKALMQQLLTGKKRLPGFTGEWRNTSLYEICTLNPKSPKIEELTQISFIPMDGVSNDARISDVTTRAFKKENNGFSYFQKKDVLVAKITPCFENGKGGYLNALPTQHGFGSTEFHVLRATADADGKFIYYITTSERFRILGEMNMQGSAGQKRVPKDFIERFSVNLPPLPEQKAIAAVLTTADEEITAIESDLLRLRQEKKALMQQLLTGKRRVTVD